MVVNTTQKELVHPEYLEYLHFEKLQDSQEYNQKKDKSNVELQRLELFVQVAYRLLELGYKDRARKLIYVTMAEPLLQALYMSEKEHHKTLIKRVSVQITL